MLHPYKVAEEEEDEPKHTLSMTTVGDHRCPSVMEG